MKKKICPAIIAAMMVICTTLCVTITSFADANGYSDGYGYKKTILVNLPALNINKQIGYVEKCFPSCEYSKIGINPANSTVNKVNVWITNSQGNTVSSKYTIFPDGNIATVYYDGVSFNKGSTVTFWGEQGNIAGKNATFVLYSY